MACRFEITLASQDAAWVPAARAALNEVDRIEDRAERLSRDEAPSAASIGVPLPAAATAVEIDERCLALLDQCGELHRATGGAFDITSTPLSRCWGFLRREGRVPSTDAIEAARASVGFDAVDLDRAATHGAFRSRPGSS